MTKKPTAQELIDQHFASKEALSAITAEEWTARVVDVFARADVRAAVAELEVISDNLPVDNQVSQVLKSFVQATKVLPVIIAQQAQMKAATEA